MPLVVYPATLPPPSAGWTAVLRDRAARSSIPGMPQARRRWRDQVVDVTAGSWVYSGAEMATWREWFSNTLVDGQLWFAAELPGAGGWLDRVLRYRPASLRVQPLGAGHCRVSAQLEVRGRSEPPRVAGDEHYANVLYLFDGQVDDEGRLIDHSSYAGRWSMPSGVSASSNFGRFGRSILIDGAHSGISLVAAGANSGASFDTGNWCCDGWIYATADARQAVTLANIALGSNDLRCQFGQDIFPVIPRMTAYVAPDDFDPGIVEPDDHYTLPRGSWRYFAFIAIDDVLHATIGGQDVVDPFIGAGAARTLSASVSSLLGNGGVFGGSVWLSDVRFTANTPRVAGVPFTPPIAPAPTFGD